jgi:hypothetical protein
MKLLVLFVGHEMKPDFVNSIQFEGSHEIEYGAISNQNDFEKLGVPLKYRMINPKRQLGKVCDFFVLHPNLPYDWVFKTRPDLEVLRPIDLAICTEHAINARARVYKGPRQIPFGMSIHGEGIWKDVAPWDTQFHSEERDIVLDDQCYLIPKNAFSKFKFVTPKDHEHEWVHTETWKLFNIPLHVIGLSVKNTKWNTYSGNIP